VLTFAYRNFEKRVPDPGELAPDDHRLLDLGDTMLEEVGRSIALCRFREGLQTAMAYAQEANRYLNQNEPWQAIKGDRPAAGRAIFTALGAIEALKVGLYPYVPFSAQRLHAMLGHAGAVQDRGWRSERPRAGSALNEPAPLFRKLETPE
jgi:methionyl-tRNA synthetase